MAEDLLDHWVNIIKTIFPPNAWIVSQDSKNNHVIQIDWKLANDSRRQNKRSRKIQIIIKEDAIDDYLDRNKPGRDLFNMTLEKLFRERFNQFEPDNDNMTINSAPIETWLFSKDILTEVINKHAFANI